MSIAQIIELMQEAKDAAKPNISAAMVARRLIDHHRELSVAHVFKVGDLVQLKTAFGENYRYPQKGYPAIVTELIDPPYVDPEKGRGSPECQLKHDVRLAVLTAEGGVLEFVFCGRTLEPYAGEVESA